MNQLRAPYQARDIFKPFHARTQRFAVGVTHRRAGKALDVSTPIPLADGTWKAMGEIVDGDTVFDEMGNPAEVLAAHPVLEGRPCYAMRFSDGAEIVCDEDHLWVTQTKLDRARHPGVRRGPRGASKYISRTHAPREGTARTTAEIASFEAAIMGAYYGREMAAAADEGRLRQSLPVLPGPIHTAWDFGNGLNMAVWAFQVGERGPLVHDFIQMSGCYFEDYLKEVIKRGYNGIDYVPHDAKVPSFETGRTRIETMLGPPYSRRPSLVANHNVDDGINAVKLMLPRATFNATACVRPP